MRAYRVASGRRLSPFDEPVRGLHVSTRRIEDWQAAAVRSAGLELVDVEDVAEAVDRPCLVFWDDVFFTEMALRHFLADALSAREERALAMPDSPAVHALAPASDARGGPDGSVVYDVFFLREPTPARDRAALAERCAPSAQRLREGRVAVRLPRGDGGPGAVEAPLTARVVAHVRHWLHLLRLSQLAIGVELLDRLRAEPRRILALRLFGRGDPWRIARRLVFVHPTARVHPTADLEAAVVGPGCVVRAHAHVHGSVLGEGVEVGDHAVVMGCALADRVQVLRASYLALCAAMPGASLASYKVQLSLFGRDVFLTSSAWLLDAKLRGEVRIEHEGRLIPIGTPYLGACLGHRVVLGAQATIGTGRAVPNDLTILGPTGQVALDVPPSPVGSILTVRDGRVVPIEGPAGRGPDREAQPLSEPSVD
jgi:hypothetical protein